MKRTLKIIAVFLFAIISTTHCYAGGKEFKGIVIYNISYGEDLDQSIASMMPKTMKMFISGEKSRVEINTGFGNTVAIFNGSTNEGFVLMDMMGQKYAMKQSSGEIETMMAESSETVVEMTGETKEIAGYVCKKASVKVNGLDSEHFVYFTEELGTGAVNKNNPMYYGIEGVMLEYVSEEKGMEMNFSAISVEKKKVSDDMFEIPEGYNIVTEEELQNMFGG